MSHHPEMPSVVVTGARGFIGQAMVRYLAEAGHPVKGLTRGNGADRPAGAVTVPDYAEGERLAPLLHGAQVVIHLAGVAHRATPGDPAAARALFADNERALLGVLAASRQAGVRRVVLVSSIGVNGDHSTDQPFREDDVPVPAEPYAHSKWRCEQILREAAAAWQDLEFTIVRPPLVYGPGAPGNFARLAGAVARGAWLPLGCVHSPRSFVGLDNLLSLLRLCTWHPRARGELFLVSDGEDVSTAEFVRRLARAMGQRPRLLPVPVGLLRMVATLGRRRALVERLVRPLVIDAGKARSRLGWSPPFTLDEGLRRAVSGGMHRP